VAKNNKNTVLESVVEEAVQSRAMELARNSVETNNLIKGELQLQHTTQMATIAIDLEVDNDKSTYDAQRRALKAARAKRVSEREDLVAQSNKARDAYVEELGKKLQKEYAANAKILKGIKGLVGDECKVPEDASFSLSYETDAHDVIKKVTYVYTIDLRLKDSKYGASTSVKFEGVAPTLPTAVIEIQKAVIKVDDQLKEIDKKGEEIFEAVQELERERASLKLNLNRQTMDRSAYGAEMMETVRSMRTTKIKALPVGL